MKRHIVKYNPSIDSFGHWNTDVEEETGSVRWEWTSQFDVARMRCLYARTEPTDGDPQLAYHLQV
jgi:hypothetical protein